MLDTWGSPARSTSHGVAHREPFISSHGNPPLIACSTDSTRILRERPEKTLIWNDGATNDYPARDGNLFFVLSCRHKWPQTTNEPEPVVHVYRGRPVEPVTFAEIALDAEE